jgi:hypothetical protein
MPQCPNCHSEVKPEERFCGNCGARLEPSIPPPAAAPAGEPPRTSGKETIVLPKITDLTMQPPPPPATDATIVSTPQPAPPAPTPQHQPPVAPTMISTPPSVPPTPTGPQGGGYGGAEVPPIYATPAPAAKSGSSVWKILGIIVGIVVLLCVVMSVAGYLLYRRAVSASGDLLGTASAGISDGTFATLSAGLETVVVPSLEPFATAEAESTPVPSSGDAAGPTLYSDNFDSEQSSDFTAETNESSVYKFADGTYQITVTKPKLISWATMRGDYGDASISVDASIDGPSASAAGLIFHYKDDKNFYIYSVDGEGRYELDVYKDDKPITLVDWTESPAIKHVGETNTLRVETSGDTIRLYANDKLLDEVSDSTIANGKAALVVNTFDDPNVTVAFDNLVVRGLK